MHRKMIPATEIEESLCAACGLRTMAREFYQRNVANLLETFGFIIENTNFLENSRITANEN